MSDDRKPYVFKSENAEEWKRGMQRYIDHVGVRSVLSTISELSPTARRWLAERLREKDLRVEFDALEK